jgi:hypothetical protein
MALRTRVWSAGKLLLLAGALFLTYAIFAAASMRVALRAREVIVPSLGGQTVNDATAALADAGLTLKVEEARRPDPKVPSGHILTQDPAPGSRTRRQRSVKVWVSAGPRSNRVPPLTGESERAAELQIKQDGLELAGISEIRSADYPADTVISQTPPPSSAGGRVEDCRARRGGRSPAPDRGVDQEAGAPGWRSDQPGDACRRARGDCRRSGRCARDVRQSGIRRADFHPAQRV